MKRLTLMLLGLLACSALLWAAPGALAQGGGEIAYGDTIFATFNATGEEHVYTFAGETGDEITVRAEVQDVSAVMEGRTGLTLDATVIAPDGSELAMDKRQDTFGHVLLDGALPAAGTYTLAITNLTGTGEYKLAFDGYSSDAIVLEGEAAEAYLEALEAGENPDINDYVEQDEPEEDLAPPPVTIPPTPLAPGATLAYGEGGTGAIDAVGERDTYTFTGSAGDIVRITMEHVEHYSQDVGFDPVLYLLAPDGTELTHRSARPDTFLDAQIVYQLPADGTYTIVAADYLDMGRGAYGLLLDQGTQAMLDALPPELPPDGMLAVGDEPVVGYVAEQGVPVEATFEGQAGQIVSIAMDVYDQSTLDPYLVLLGPDGSEIARDDDSGGGTNPVTALIVTELPADGVYTIHMTSPPNSPFIDYFGYFLLTLTQQENAAAGQVFEFEGLDYGVQETIPLDGAAGRVVVLRVEPLDDLSPDVGVYTPDEQLIAQATGNETDYAFAVLLPDDGDYLVKVGSDLPGRGRNAVRVTLVYQGDDPAAAGLAIFDEAALDAALAEAEAAAEAQQPPLCTATALQGANLRGGPGTENGIVGGVSVGDVLTISLQTAAGDWFMLQVEGVAQPWIAAFLVTPPECPDGGTPPVVGQ